MTKEEFVAQLDRAAAGMGANLPVTGALVRHMSDALKKGEPAWWKNVQKAWEGRKFVAWTEAWGLFLTAVHYDVLGEAESPLVRYFPSCGGTAEADPTSVFARYLNDVPRTFFEKLRYGHRRTFIQQRANLWLAPAASFFQRRGLPYYVVEVNAGAGLNLAADVISPLKGFNSDLVAARIGLDPAPLRVDDINDRRWLTAAIMPEQLDQIGALDKAIDAVAKRLREEANFIQLVACDSVKAPAFVAKNIPSDDEDVGLLVFNMGTTVRMTDAEYQKFYADMGKMLAPWGDRALWFEVENVRGELYSTTYQGVLHRPGLNGTLADCVMLRFDLATGKVDVSADVADKFLAVPPRAKK